MLEDKLLHEAPLAFIDVETTGLKPALGHRVVEICIMRTQGLREVERFSSLIDPQRPLDRRAMRVNHITPEMVNGAPVFRDVIPEITPLLSGAVLVGHNVTFDLGFLQSELLSAGAEQWQGIALCTMWLARNNFDLPSYSLDFFAEALHITNGRAHRAEADVLTTYEVFKYFIADLSDNGELSVRDWLSLQGGDIQTAFEILPEELQIALREQRMLQIVYIDSYGNLTERQIAPVSCNNGYLVAYCYLREDQRTFRLDRICEMKLI